MNLTFRDLRRANVLRLPQFKNRHGQPAHSEPDGSDWSVAQWFQAFIGEVGEFAEARIDFEHGKTNTQQYASAAANELADVATYMDILARRALDDTEESPAEDRAQLLMLAVMHIGRYANNAKKRERGDIGDRALWESAEEELQQAIRALGRILQADFAPNHPTTFADPHGVNLSTAICNKFNEVSERVGSNITLTDRGPFDRHGMQTL